MSKAESWRVKLQLFLSKYMTRPGPHQLVYRLTGGLVGSRLPSMKPGVLLLTVKGRRTGKLRTTPLVHLQIDGRSVVGATNGGEDQDPAWCRNLRSHPDATIQVGRRKQRVRARQAKGAERHQLWASMTEVHPLFAAYQQRTSREIPVVVLEPVEEPGG